MSKLLPEAILRASKPTDYVLRWSASSAEKLVTQNTLNAVVTGVTLPPVVWLVWDYFAEKKAATERGETYKYLTPKKVMLHFAVGSYLATVLSMSAKEQCS